MTLLSFLDISEWSAVEWSLFGGLVVALVAYYFWPEPASTADAEVGVDEATRKQAKPIIAVAKEGVDEQLFTLEHMPLLIRAGEKFKAAVASGEALDELAIREALWVQQRAMITRLESELDYAQQADVSEHFAIAAPANQPGALLEKTLKDLEGMLTQIRKHLKIDDSIKLWHGRAFIFMMATRKLFDHVAWLTGAGLAHSAPGSFMLAGDRVVMISIYATRLGGFARPLTFQVCRATVRCVGGERTPLWLEYGLAQWITDQMLGKPTLAKDEKPVEWEEACRAIFEENEWTKASEDSTRLERLVAWSGVYVSAVKAKGSDAFVRELAQLHAVDEATAKQLIDAMAGQAVAAGPVAAVK